MPRNRLPCTLPGGGCGPSSISVSSPRGRLRTDFVLHDLGRLRRQGQEGEEVAPADRIRTKPPFETPQRVLVLKQGDHDAFRRGMLALREPGVSAAGCRLDCRRMSPENIESFGLLALLETETGEPEEHVRRTAAASQRPSGTSSRALRVDDAEQVALGIIEDHEVFARFPRPAAGRAEAQQ